MADVILTEGNDNFPSSASLGADIIAALAGDDTVYAGDGADTVYGESGNDVIGDAFEGAGDEAADSLHGGDGNDRLYGSTLSDFLFGDNGDDSLSGRGTMMGGAGSDRYYVNSNEGLVVELQDEGADVVYVYNVEGTYVLPDNIETMWVERFFDDSIAMGNSLDNVIGIFEPGDLGEYFVELPGTVNGMGGNDTIYGSQSIQRLFGGDGDDSFLIRREIPDVLVGGSGIDTIFATDGLIRSIDLSLYDGVENAISTSRLNNTTIRFIVYGTDDANIIGGVNPSVRLLGYAGDDTLLYYGHSSNSIFEGGDGYDTIDCSVATAPAMLNMTVVRTSGVTSVERVIGSAFGDTITGNTEANRIEGREGNDSISGANGDDALYGNDGDDTLHGDNGNDTLSGGAGTNAVYGDAGNDILIANLGSDTLHGGDGNDRFRVSVAGTTIVELADEGVDQVFTSVDFTLASNVERMTSLGIGLTLVGNDLANILFGDSGNNAILGGSGNDNIRGAAGDDTVRGEGGNDAVLGDTGNDSVFGGSGNDVLTGGQGLDQLTGGLGRDSFRFDLASDTGSLHTQADRILDFSQSEGDRIALSGIDANSAITGDQAFAFIGNAGFSGAGGELRAVRFDGNTYVIGDVNGDSTGDFYIRLDGLYFLAAADFVL